MRTSELCNFKTRIAEINNNLSHVLFVFKQFSIDNESNFKKKKSLFTTEVYASNPFAEQFNVKLGNLESQAQTSLEYILDTLFVFTHTQFEVYLKDVYLFCKHNSTLKLVDLPNTKIYDNVMHELNIDVEKDIDNLLVSTYEYFRYRRNAIMHRDKSKRFQGALKSLVTGKKKKDNFDTSDEQLRENQLNGTELNTHWNRYREDLIARNQKAYTVHSFNFANRDLSVFSLTELLDVFNFYRLYASIIDGLVLSKVPKESLLNYCLIKHKEFYGQELESDFEKFKNRFKRSCIFALNINATDEEILKVHNGK